jgi:integrase
VAIIRSAKQGKNVFERLIYPSIGSKSIDEVKRSDINKMLDKIEDKNGAAAADQALAFVRKVTLWHARRVDDLRSPIVPGMARTSATERTRKHTLTDDELRAVWRATASLDPFNAMVRMLLLCACRRDEVREMPHSELKDGVWTIPASRYKNGWRPPHIEHAIPLSATAQALLATLPVIGPGDYVFTLDGVHAIGNMGARKTRLDKASGVCESMTAYKVGLCRTTTFVPTETRSYKSITSPFASRKHPEETALPIACG